MAVAVLDTCPPALASSILTRYSTVAPVGRVSVLGRLPPWPLVAPLPRLNTTRLPAWSWNAWSSPCWSVFAPALGPLTIRSDPGTYVVPAGMVSVRVSASASPPPSFLATIR